MFRIWDTYLTYLHLLLKNEKQDFDKIFRNEALNHCAASSKILSSGSCCYGNRNSFFVFFSMTDISAGGEANVLKSWQFGAP